MKETEREAWFAHLRKSSGVSDKSWIIAFALSLVFGFWGFDRFYVGRYGWGVVKFLTVGGFCFLWLLDVILLLVNRLEDGDGKVVKRPF